MNHGSADPGASGPLDGATLAAVLAAGIGAAAMGAFVIANEAGLFSAPSLYGPSGGLSGRSTFAVAIWLAAWATLHARWRDRRPAAAPILRWTIILVALGVLLTFPPVWELL